MNNGKDCHINIFYDLILFTLWMVERCKFLAEHNVLLFWRYFYDLYADKMRESRRANHIEKMEG